MQKKGLLTYNLFVFSMLKKDSAPLFQVCIQQKAGWNSYSNNYTGRKKKGITLLLLTIMPLYCLKENLGLQIEGNFLVLYLYQLFS